MSNGNSKFWAGLALGALGGALLTQQLLSPRRMPNAKSWQKLLSTKMGETGAAVLLGRVQQRYDELIAQRVIFDRKALQGHLTENILPGLALYQTLRSDGLEKDAALAQMDTLYAAQYQPGGTNLSRLERIFKLLPGNFNAFKWLARNAMQRGFPTPGFELEYIPDDPTQFGFNIQRCFYLDMLTYFGAPELTNSFCKIDDFTMSALPKEIQWKRSGTLGMGADHCDFRWNYVPLKKVEESRADPCAQS